MHNPNANVDFNASNTLSLPIGGKIMIKGVEFQIVGNSDNRLTLQPTTAKIS